MKWNQLILTATLSLISMNALAIEISHGKLLNHKEWTKGNVKGSIQDITSINPAEKIKLLKSTQFDNNTHEDGIYIETNVDQKYVQQNNTTVFGTMFSYVENMTPSTQTYTIKTRLCILDRKIANFDCIFVSDTVQLDSHGFFYLSRAPQLDYDFSGANATTDYILTINSYAQRSDQTTYFATSSSTTLSVLSNG